MPTVFVEEKVMEKVQLMSKLTERTPDEVVHDILWEELHDLQDIPDEIDVQALWDMLDHDCPGGDGFLDRIID